MVVEAVCCDYERDGIYVAIKNKCASVVCHYCPTKMNLAIHKIKTCKNMLAVFFNVQHSSQLRMTQFFISTSRKVL